MRLPDLYNKVLSKEPYKSKTSLTGIYSEGVLKEVPPSYPDANADLDAIQQRINARKAAAAAQPASTPAPDPEPVQQPATTAQPVNEFDQKIISHLHKLGITGDDAYPRQGIELPNTSTVIHITDPHDKRLWAELYSLHPSKKGEATGATKGSGNGEMALYWMLKKHYGNNVVDSRSAGAPDLKVNDIGVEVKAYGKNDIKLGKFRSAPRYVIDLLNYIFGFNALLSSITRASKTPEELATEARSTLASDTGAANPGYFNYASMVAALEQVNVFSKILDGDAGNALIQQYDIFKEIKKKIDFVNTRLARGQQGGDRPEDKANEMMRAMIREKLKEKPGFGGYVVDVVPNGSLHFYHITEDKINSINVLAANIVVNNAEITFNFNAAFGKQ